MKLNEEGASMKQKYIIQLIILIGIVLISGQKGLITKEERGSNEKVAPPLYTWGFAKAYAIVVKPFTTREFGNPYIIIKLTDIYEYKTGKSEKQLINNGDKIEVNIIGKIDWSKCPELAEESSDWITKDTSIAPCGLTDEQQYGSWKSWNLKEGDIIQIFVKCKGMDNGECSYWEARDEILVEAGISENDFKNIVYLSPSDFKELPKSIVKYLENNKCKIPQPFFYKSGQKKYNVIKGNFYSKNQYDWAVMCSKNHISKIIIFKSASTKKIDILKEFKDVTGLQELGSGKMEFSLDISVISKKDMVDYNGYKSEELEEPLKIEHDGIVFAFEEKGSSVYYNRKGKWIELPGSD